MTDKEWKRRKRRDNFIFILPLIISAVVPVGYFIVNTYYHFGWNVHIVAIGIFVVIWAVSCYIMRRG